MTNFEGLKRTLIARCLAPAQNSQIAAEVRSGIDKTEGRMMAPSNPPPSPSPAPSGRANDDESSINVKPPASSSGGGVSSLPLRPVKLEDFRLALQGVLGRAGVLGMSSTTSVAAAAEVWGSPARVKEEAASAGTAVKKPGDGGGEESGEGDEESYEEGGDSQDLSDYSGSEAEDGEEGRGETDEGSMHDDTDGMDETRGTHGPDWTSDAARASNSAAAALAAFYGAGNSSSDDIMRKLSGFNSDSYHSLQQQILQHVAAAGNSNSGEHRFSSKSQSADERTLASFGGLFSAANAADASRTMAGLGVKRGPGRPRKRPMPGTVEGLQVKRPRGRPKKNPQAGTPGAAAASASPRAPVSCFPVSLTGRGEGGGSVTPTGSSMEPLLFLSNSNSAIGLAGEAPSATGGSGMGPLPGEVSVKRGPGRPRKNPVGQPAVKRPPGRPRKNPVLPATSSFGSVPSSYLNPLTPEGGVPGGGPDMAGSSELSAGVSLTGGCNSVCDSVSSDVTPQFKRPRGRPRKQPMVPDSDVAMSKRPRGRPKKSLVLSPTGSLIPMTSSRDGGFPSPGFSGMTMSASAAAAALAFASARIAAAIKGVESGDLQSLFAVTASGGNGSILGGGNPATPLSAALTGGVLLAQSHGLMAGGKTGGGSSGCTPTTVEDNAGISVTSAHSPEGSVAMSSGPPLPHRRRRKQSAPAAAPVSGLEGAGGGAENNPKSGIMTPSSVNTTPVATTSISACASAPESATGPATGGSSASVAAAVAAALDAVTPISSMADVSNLSSLSTPDSRIDDFSSRNMVNTQGLPLITPAGVVSHSGSCFGTGDMAESTGDSAKLLMSGGSCSAFLGNVVKALGYESSGQPSPGVLDLVSSALLKASPPQASDPSNIPTHNVPAALNMNMNMNSTGSSSKEHTIVRNLITDNGGTTSVPVMAIAANASAILSPRHPSLETHNNNNNNNGGHSTEGYNLLVANANAKERFGSADGTGVEGSHPAARTAAQSAALSSRASGGQGSPGAFLSGCLPPVPLPGSAEAPSLSLAASSGGDAAHPLGQILPLSIPTFDFKLLTTGGQQWRACVPAGIVPLSAPSAVSSLHDVGGVSQLMAGSVDMSAVTDKSYPGAGDINGGGGGGANRGLTFRSVDGTEGSASLAGVPLMNDFSRMSA